jgi:hypothetical protein
MKIGCGIGKEKDYFPDAGSRVEYDGTYELGFKLSAGLSCCQCPVQMENVSATPFSMC